MDFPQVDINTTTPLCRSLGSPVHRPLMQGNGTGRVGTATVQHCTDTSAHTKGSNITVPVYLLNESRFDTVIHHNYSVQGRKLAGIIVNLESNTISCRATEGLFDRFLSFHNSSCQITTDAMQSVIRRHCKQQLLSVCPLCVQEEQ